MKHALVTLKDAAEQLGVQPGTLRRQIHMGRIRAEKHGRDWFVTSAEIERYRSEVRSEAMQRQHEPPR